jgi:hypothetical protein
VNSPIISTGIGEYAAISLSDDRAERIEAPESRNRAARGAITGVLLGAGFWGAILVVVGFIKL